MRLLAICIIGALLAGVAGDAGAAPVDVPFQGDVSGLCALSLPTQGGLVLDSNGDLTSSGTLPGTVTILSVGSNSLSITPPVWVQPAAGYVAGTEHFLVSWLGLAGLGISAQGYTETPAPITIATAPISILTVNAKVTNSSGFAPGTYKLKVTVTCGP
ncbi:MAG: hypothetical protein ABI697_10655 [Devosia sp.]